jgi:FkbM family methyltransferase
LKKGISPPNVPLPLLYRACERLGTLERELRALSIIVPQGGTAIDIGANVGLWTYALSKYFNRVEAFEPQPGLNNYLRRSNLKKVTVYPVALSSEKCEMMLNIPSHHGLSIRGMATFGKVEGPCDSVNVSVNRLDDYDFHGISFMKIDVEGHESQVLQGGRKTIEREKPVMVIEIEQRHLDIPMTAVIQNILDMGYAGLFLNEGKLCPISEFDCDEYQKAYLQGKSSRYAQLPKKYGNNFIFKPVGAKK